jgi:hypothetical protein
MRKAIRAVFFALLGILVLAACEPKHPVVSTERGEQLTTERGEPLRSYTARVSPEAPQ